MSTVSGGCVRSGGVGFWLHEVSRVPGGGWIGMGAGGHGCGTYGMALVGWVCVCSVGVHV